MMRLLCIYLTLVSACLGPTTAQRCSNQTLERYRLENIVPALGASRIVDNQASWLASGYRKWNNSTPVSDNDKWHLGSMTKSMTATLLAILIEEGLLRWDSLVKDVVAPQVASTLHPDYNNVTIEMLTTQTSGIYQPDQLSISFSERFFNSELPVVQGRLEWTQASLNHSAVFRPGTEFQYSNTNYIILGHMMEWQTKSDWETLMRNKLFGPLGMTDCGFYVAPEPSPGAVDQPWPHKLSNNSGVTPVDPFSRYADNPKTWGPANSVHCTLAHWSIYLNMHMRGHNGKPVSISTLTQASFQKLHTPLLSNFTYGAWQVTRRSWAGNGRNTVLYFTGSNLQNYAVAWLDVEGERGYSAVTNSAGPGDVGGRGANVTDFVVDATIKEMILPTGSCPLSPLGGTSRQNGPTPTSTSDALLNVDTTFAVWISATVGLLLGLGLVTLV